VGDKFALNQALYEVVGVNGSVATCLNTNTNEVEGIDLDVAITLRNAYLE